jgi:hypothetical protein
MFEAFDARNEAYVNFLRSILGRTVAAFTPANEVEAMRYDMSSFALADLEDLLSQFWMPGLVPHLHIEDTLRRLECQGDMSFEQLTVCFDYIFLSLSQRVYFLKNISGMKVQTHKYIRYEGYILCWGIITV